MTRNALFFLFLILFTVNAETQEDCAAIVEYITSIGNPEAARTSPLFRGVTRLVFLEPAVESDEIDLQWTFTGGETIRGEKDIFEEDAPDVSDGDIADIQFESLIRADTQFIQLTINSSTSTGHMHVDHANAFLGAVGNHAQVRLEFFGFKGSDSSSDGQDATEDRDYRVSLPDWFLVDDLACRASPLLLQSERHVSEPRERMGDLENSDILLEYSPRELREFRYEGGTFSTATLFTFRLHNTAPEAVDLSDLVVEYWFDGADEGVGMETMQGPSTYKSECSWSSLGCKFMKTEVQSGLENVQGAQYKVVISFSDNVSSLLLLNEQSRQEDNDDGLYRYTAAVRVTSSRDFSQMDVITDYSFKNTSVRLGESDSSKQYIKRRLEANPRMPVYKRGELIWGSPPIAGQTKVNLTEIDEDGNFCYLRSDTIPQCGLKMRYCCRPASSEPRIPFPNIGDNDADSQQPTAVPAAAVTDDDGAEEWIPIWISGAIAGTLILIAISCFILLFRRSSKSGWIWSSITHADISPSNRFPLQEDDSSFGSFAWSIEDSGGPANSKEHLPGHKVSDQSWCDTKFHTVPSISESEYHSLVKICGKEDDGKQWSSKGYSSWTGCVHWVWEPWDATTIRRSKTTTTPCQRLATFETSTKKIQNIPLDVDYTIEIEPYLGSLLGEGGFGQVFAANWKGQPVAVKMMKVDTEAMYKNLKDEVKLTSRICHERIVRLLAACLADKNRICLIMELVENGNLSRRIHNRNLRKLEYLQVLQIGLDIAHGLSYLHPTVIHRDLKPQNVLLDRNGRAKIADFGISKFKDPHRSYLSVTQTGGTPNYMAPELFNGTRVDEKCDIYSLGCILYEAMTRRVPLSDLPSDNCAPLFQAQSSDILGCLCERCLMQIIKTVAIDKRRPKIPDFFPHGLAHVIRQCWKDNPRSRPSASDVCTALENLIEKEIKHIEGARRAFRDAAFTPRLQGKQGSSPHPDLEILGLREQFFSI